MRVPEDDRDLLRQWFRMRARRFYGPTEWLDVAFSWQSDPGMQAEFFERDYLSYEQKDIFLHWRKAEGSTYWSASVKPQLEDRTETLELPKAGWYLGRHPAPHRRRRRALHRAGQCRLPAAARGQPELLPPLPGATPTDDGERRVARRTPSTPRGAVPAGLRGRA